MPRSFSDAESSIRKAQERYSRVGIISFGKSRVHKDSSPSMHFFHLADQETRQIEVMHRHIKKESPAPPQKFEARRISIAPERSKKFDPTKLASLNFLLGARVAGIEPSHKSEVNGDSSFLDQIHDSRCLRQIECNRFLGEYGFSGLCRNLQQPGVRIRRRHDNRGVDSWMAYRLFDVGHCFFSVRDYFSAFCGFQP